MGIRKELQKIVLVVIKKTRCLQSTNTKLLQAICKVQIQSFYKLFVKYKYKVLDDDYVNNLKEMF